MSFLRFNKNVTSYWFKIATENVYRTKENIGRKRNIRSKKYMYATYSHHIITLHVWLILILTLVVKFAEKVKGHHGVKIHNYSQQTHSQHQLGE